jgi:Asp-tRNA(Asn)/Glu-tRNA(Gln) amidotransferase A subunit family amidase
MAKQECFFAGAARIDGKEYVYPDQLAWPGIATLPGLPSTAIPTGFAPDGLPVGMQTHRPRPFRRFSGVVLTFTY